MDYRLNDAAVILGRTPTVVRDLLVDLPAPRDNTRSLSDPGARICRFFGLAGTASRVRPRDLLRVG